MVLREHRFILRNEFFGSVVYDKLRKGYYHLDAVATQVLKGVVDPCSEGVFSEHGITPAEIGSIREELSELGMHPSLVEFRSNDPVPGVLSAPLRVFYEITQRCPEKCRHCYTDAGAAHERELSRSDKLALIDQMVEIGCFRLSIAGGEPLVDPDFFPLLEYAQERQVDVSFSTSGIPVSKKVAKRLAKCDVRTVNVSLDGWDEESYGSVRGRDRFKLMVRGVRTLRTHYAGKVAAKVTLMTTNAAHLDRVIALAEELGFDVVKFNCVRAAGRAEESRDLVLSAADYHQAVKYLADLYNSGRTSIKMVLPVNPFQALADGDQVDVVGELGFGCYAGKESFCVRPTGDVQPCSSFPEHLFNDGNVRDYSLADLWLTGSAMKTFRGLTGSSNCSTCEVYDGCRGGCYLRAFDSTGDINALDPYCYTKEEPIRARALPLVHESTL